MEGLAQLVSLTRTAISIYWDNKRIRNRFDIVLIQQYVTLLHCLTPVSSRMTTSQLRAKNDMLALIPGLLIFMIPSTRLKVATIRRAPFLYPLVFVTPRLHELVIQDTTKQRQQRSQQVLEVLCRVSDRSVQSSSDLLSQRLKALVGSGRLLPPVDGWIRSSLNFIA